MMSIPHSLRPLVLLAALATPVALGTALAPAALANDESGGFACDQLGLQGTERKPYIVYFGVDQTALTAESRATLKEAAEEAKSRYIFKICLVGQADKQGNADYNKRLAQRRAQAVLDHMAGLGLPAKYMQTHSRGEAYGALTVGPVAKSDRNVRVMFLD